MAVSIKRVGLTVGLILATVAATGCARVKGYQGYIADDVLISNVQPGIDNLASVEKTLGRPTFIGEFNKNDWYYVARQTRQYAFAIPTPTQQTVLRVQFDGTGTVTAVDKSGVERVIKIRPNGDKTPTLGKDSNFFQELFGNIGQVGSVGQSGGSTDNPN
jgi:outer membrane protein assembly factor BamE (lipoprotein component of BamABCDE complex)